MATPHTQAQTYASLPRSGTAINRNRKEHYHSCEWIKDRYGLLSFGSQKVLLENLSNVQREGIVWAYYYGSKADALLRTHTHTLYYCYMGASLYKKTFSCKSAASCESVPSRDKSKEGKDERNFKATSWTGSL